MWGYSRSSGRVTTLKVAARMKACKVFRPSAHILATKEHKVTRSSYIVFAQTAWFHKACARKTPFLYKRVHARAERRYTACNCISEGVGCIVPRSDVHTCE